MTIASKPRLTPAQIAANDENKSRAGAFRDAFVNTYCLRRYQVTHRNAYPILQSGGASRERVRTLFGTRWGDVPGSGISLLSGPFDHSEMWGRNGVPMALIGQPYNMGETNTSQVEAIRSLGLRVTIDKDSHYGFGTYRVIVWHAELVPSGIVRTKCETIACPHQGCGDDRVAIVKVIVCHREKTATADSAGMAISDSPYSYSGIATHTVYRCTRGHEFGFTDSYSQGGTTRETWIDSPGVTR